MIAAIFKRALQAIDEGENFALVTVIESEGSSPGKPGHKMIVFADGRQEGTAGGGQFEHRVKEEALAMIQRGEGGLLHYSFDPTSEDSIGMLCGGKATVAVEVVKPKAHILLCGAGHVGWALTQQFDQLGFTYAVLDAREDLTSPERFPRAGALIHASPEAFINEQSVAGYSHVIVMTHDHALDRDAMLAVATSGFAGYVGLIGSRRKWATIRAALSEAEIPEDWIGAVHCPIGLPIGGSRPAEIAISITAEILQELYADK